MITLPTSQVQNTDCSRRSSSRHVDARANARWRSQLVRRSALLKPDTYTRSGLVMRGNVVDQCTHGCRSLPQTSSAAFNSP